MWRTKLRACDEVALRMLQERMILSQTLAISSHTPYTRIASIYGVLRILEVLLSIINLHYAWGKTFPKKRTFKFNVSFKHTQEKNQCPTISIEIIFYSEFL